MAVWMKARRATRLMSPAKSCAKRGRAPEAEAEQEQREQARPPGGIGGDGQHEQRAAEQAEAAMPGGRSSRAQRCGMTSPARRNPARAGSRQQTSSGTYHQNICARTRRAGMMPAWTAIS